MASGGAFPDSLSDHSTLWISRRAIEDFDGTSFEGRGVAPDDHAAALLERLQAGSSTGPGGGRADQAAPGDSRPIGRDRTFDVA
jgi:hypothetical protein